MADDTIQLYNSSGAPVLVKIKSLGGSPEQFALAVDAEVSTSVEGTHAEDAASADGDKGMGMLAVRKATPANTSGTDGDFEFLQMSAGKLWVRANDLETLLAGGLPAALGGSGGLKAELLAGVASGLLRVKNLDIDETEDAVKASAGALYGMFLANRSTGERFVKLYDNTVVGVTVGTTVPDETYPLSPGEKMVVTFPQGIPFATALTVAATTGIADNDSGAPGTNDIVGVFWYK